MNEIELLQKASTKRVLFAGEAIVDQYFYCAPLGRPSKDLILSVEQQRDVRYTGGVDAAAAHARELTRQVTIRNGGVTYAKCRFLEQSHDKKLFQYYKRLTGNLNTPPPNFEPFDVVACLDYGHEMFTRATVPLWSVGARFLAVNVQTNSGNFGYNLATKWRQLDYLCVDEDEARLATLNRDGSIKHSLIDLSARAKRVVITLGKHGAVGYQNGEVTYCPAFTDSVRDTIGAGDAFFAVTAVIAADADMLSLLRIGNAAGALKAGIIGHQRGIKKDDLVRLLSEIPRSADTSTAKLPM